MLGTLEYGQYGVVSHSPCAFANPLTHGQIDVVTCKFNGVAYVRKSIEKKFALKAQDVRPINPDISADIDIAVKQCSPQFERDILLRALKSRAKWAPHLLCAFQTDTHLNMVMDYAEGGTLWDVLESSPLDGRISDSDIRWWAPQIVSALHWCHSQGFVHRYVDSLATTICKLKPCQRCEATQLCS